MDSSNSLLFKNYIIKKYDEYELSKYFDLSNNKSHEFLILTRVIENLNNGKLVYPLSITSSSGSVLVLIFDNFVIKLFLSELTYNKEIKIIEKCNSKKNIINGIGYISLINGKIIKRKFIDINHNLNDTKTNIFLSIIQKLNMTTYINNNRLYLTINLDNVLKLMKLFLDIGVALEYLHSNKTLHGDCRMDNIGYLNGEYILFDFNVSRKEDKYFDSDIDTLIKSVKFYLGSKIDERSKEFINFVKLSKNGDKLIDNILLFYREYYDNSKEDIEIYEILNSEPIC